MIIDLFAGGGGASVGIEAALGRPVDVAINHDEVAIAVHRANHPRTRHLEANVWEVRPHDVVGNDCVEVLWASPDCCHHSRAKGGKPRNAGIRSLAWVVVEWAKAAYPDVIFLENVQEFASWGPLKNGQPDRSRLGQHFDEWTQALIRAGYEVDSRLLDASDYGAPTKRVRLFVVARRDGKPIRWPTPTHGAGLLPKTPAAACIDWSLPCPSIFDRKRPLRPKTLARVAEGCRRFILENPTPFIVKLRGTSAAHVASSSNDVDEPLGTIAAQGQHFGLVAPTMIQTGYGERRGQTPRVPGLNKPIGTIVGCGCKHALVAAFLAKHYGGVYGSQLPLPLGTVTAVDHHSLVAATAVKYYGNAGAQDIGEPLHTVTSKARFALVAAFLEKHGVRTGSVCKVQVGKDTYAIADIGLRMLQPHELLAAQFGPYAAGYDLSPARTKAAKIRMIGNSVCPQVAEALVKANCPAKRARERQA